MEILSGISTGCGDTGGVKGNGYVFLKVGKLKCIKAGYSKKTFLKMESLLYLLFLTFIFCSAKSALAVAEEAEKMLDFRCRREVLFHFMDSFVQLQAGTENGAVCF